MEVGTEISQKIRSAIKAKLIELGAYVDDELPDYIMVMVANKKSQEQMISDLKLFLGKNTDAFAEWLHGLLGKLQTISVDSSAKNIKEKKKADSKKEKVKKSSKKSKNESSKSKTVTSSSQNNETVDDKTAENIESEQSAENNSKPTKSKSVLGSYENGSQPAEVEDVRQMLVTVAPTDELAAELETTEARIEQSEGDVLKKVYTQERKDNTTTVSRKRSASPENERRVQSSNVPKKHKGLSSVVANVSKDNEEEEEYDPLCPAVGSVASVVKVTSRKSRIPPALQANSTSSELSAEVDRDVAIQAPSTMIRLDETASLFHIRKVLMNVLEQQRSDDISTFCQSIASSLRKMSLRNLAIAKLRIQKILFDYESSLQTDKTPPSSVASNSQESSNPTPSEQLDSAKNSSLGSPMNTANLSNLTNSDRIIFGPKGRLPELSFSQSTSSKSEDSVSSSKNDHPSPLHGHTASTSKISNCTVEIGSSSPFYSKTLSRPTLQPSTSNDKSTNSHNISLDSLHQKRRSELESSSKGSLSKVRPLFHNVQSVGSCGDSVENPDTDSPKPISAEQLKVLAKNLKITVTNSRALKSCSKSNSDESSSEESEEETESEDESEAESIAKETGLSKENEDTIKELSVVEGSGQEVTAVAQSEVSDGQDKLTKPDQ